MTESNFSEKNKKGVSSFTFPDEPIDVARKLIQATVTAEIPKCGELYQVLEVESIEIQNTMLSSFRRLQSIFWRIAMHKKGDV